MTQKDKRNCRFTLQKNEKQNLHSFRQEAGCGSKKDNLKNIFIFWRIWTKKSAL